MNLKKIVAACVFLCSNLLIMNCSTQPEAVPTITAVSLVKPRVSSAGLQETFTGVIEENEDVKLAFRIAGPVDQIRVQEGQYVKKNQLLASMDHRDYQLKVDATRAEYDQIIAEVARYEIMHKKNSLTENDYEKALSGKKQITAKLKAAENALKDTRLLAPFDGYVQTCFISQGEMIDAGMPVVSMVDVSSLKIETSIPSKIYIYKEHFSNFFCISQNYPDRKFPLTLTGVAAKAGSNKLYKMYLTLHPAEDVLLAPGMSVQVSFSYQTQNQPLCKIPLSACFEKDNRTWVWQYVNGAVKAVEIEPGEIDIDNNLTVLSGLPADASVVRAGVHGLHEGESVKPLELK